MGEWGYVAAGYALTALTLAGYAVTLSRRARRARRAESAPRGM